MWSAFKSAGASLFEEGLGYTTTKITQKNDFAVDTRDIRLHHLYSKTMEDPSIENQQELQDELEQRLKTDRMFESMFPQFFERTKKKDYPLPTTTADFECYSNLIDLYTEACGQADTYAMKYFGNFLNQC